MLVEQPLDGTPAVDPMNSANDSLYEVTQDLPVPETFLEFHLTAKIMFIVDTHSLDNGSFVFKGEDAVSYEACLLYEVDPLCHYILQLYLTPS